MVGTVLGYPLDTLKSRLATAATSGRSESIVSIVRALGFRGLYAGVGSPLVSLVILNTMGFSSFNGFTQLLGCKSGSSDDTSDKEIFQLEPRLMLAGGLSGLCASVISTPFELLKVQMQVQKLRASWGCLDDVTYFLFFLQGYSTWQFHGVRECSNVWDWNAIAEFARLIRLTYLL